MGAEQIEGVLTTPLRRISVPAGDVLHAMKCSDPGYNGFGEVYFSLVKQGAIKGWKRHRKVTLNLVVPNGAVRFVIYDDRSDSTACGKFVEHVLSAENYIRLTIAPMLWMSFEGVGAGESIIMDVTDQVHDQHESDRCALDAIKFNWSTER
jgi:dTDP-4-dehydrorhamnose 3,5-epimerase